MLRFVAVIWNSPSSNSFISPTALASSISVRKSGWGVAHLDARSVVLHPGATRRSAEVHSLTNSSGVVLGQVFDRTQSDYRFKPRVAFSEADTSRIISSYGRYLVENYWGSYVAVFSELQAQRHHVLCEPVGTIPCYHVQHAGVDVFFSNLEDCLQLFNIPFSPDPVMLTQWLLFSELQNRSCGLAGVDHLIGGECVTLCNGTIERTLVWNATEIARNAEDASPQVAAAALRRTVQLTSDAWASCYDRIALKLSGGLDSSIIAGCLAHAPSRPRVDYLNFSIDHTVDRDYLLLPGIDKKTASKLRAFAGRGDEIQYAQLVARRWNTPLLERTRNASFDLSRLWKAPINTNPSLLFTALEVDDAEIECARDLGTEAYFSGQGGDSVFVNSIEPLPAIDYAYTHGIGRHFWKHCIDAAALSKDSFWSVLGRSLQCGVLRGEYQPPVGILQSPNLLTDEMIRRFRERDFYGFWSSASVSLPPGKRAHLRGLETNGFYNFVFNSGRFADHVDPLNSQPVWELVLQTPTYMLLTEGLSRGLARRAFADILPTKICQRIAKGTGTSFYQHVVRRNSEYLRECLLDGLLVKGNYLDRAKLENFFASDHPFLAAVASDVLSYLAAEIWLNQLKDIGNSASALPALDAETSRLHFANSDLQKLPLAAP